MVNQNRFGTTDYCIGCARKIDSIHDMRKNGSTHKEDWPSRELHKDCWILTKQYMAFWYGDLGKKKHIRYNSKCYMNKYNTENVLSFFKNNMTECVEHIRICKNIDD